MSYFTRYCKEKGISWVSSSRKAKQERVIWQRRFWVHLMHVEIDLLCHVEYIHYNPIKHGYVESLIDWKYSSFLKNAEEGLYTSNWGESESVWEGKRFME